MQLERIHEAEPVRPSTAGTVHHGTPDELPSFKGRIEG